MTSTRIGLFFAAAGILFSAVTADAGGTRDHRNGGSGEGGVTVSPSGNPRACGHSIACGAFEPTPDGWPAGTHDHR
jgi:hypothetical protein